MPRAKIPLLTFLIIYQEAWFHACIFEKARFTGLIPPAKCWREVLA